MPGNFTANKGARYGTGSGGQDPATSTANLRTDQCAGNTTNNAAKRIGSGKASVLCCSTPQQTDNEHCYAGYSEFFDIGVREL
ncbi:hypothetical protein GU3_14605 [Oceanimonas sp. GK1]|nr:hypothetical protein GU3_14605 [Oceanimonas sp. GK1]